jgi:ribulose kinase
MYMKNPDRLRASNSSSMSLIRASSKAIKGLPKSMRKILIVSRIALRISKKMRRVSRISRTGLRKSLPGIWMANDCQSAIGQLLRFVRAYLEGLPVTGFPRWSRP